MSRTINLLFISATLILLALRADAAEFAYSNDFESVEAFSSSAASFKPATAKGKMGNLFTVPELGELKKKPPVAAPSISSCNVLWADDSSALVFVSAEPPTEATRSFVGVIFLLKRINSRWNIADSLRFYATGKEAEISTELTAGTGTGYSLGGEGMRPVITVNEWHGGRGYSYGLSASYTMTASKLKRLDLR